MADKRDDFFKFVGKQLVTLVDQPAEVRQQRRQHRKEAKAVRESWVTRWFGIAPLTIMFWVNGWKNRQSEQKRRHGGPGQSEAHPQR
ncbi:YqzE-like protein [Paenibacillus cellulosilyticus]|uniref:YqzE-like protein n=1 Tax=Paenibacillus cellulosilyticus TaxID=375489 RepID=A0A2V2YHM1_9BACL|nr:YqzE family protein [Paenibacillus cellulosilyticus]PWV90987.1 YqzE-like protein [Paenibacillus cellulosilyticus]QKS45202.1 YqzE family protein [Paenibacillus cellulosilyticus]